MLKQFNCRLQPETVGMINRLAAILGCSQAAVVHQAIRLLANREDPPKKDSCKQLTEKVPRST